MYAVDFEYDGKQLSDYGMMICSFDSSGLETVSSGSDITFNTVKPTGSNNSKLYGTRYEEMYTSTFQVCCNPCNGEKMYLEPAEVSSIQRWLCKEDGYHKFKIIQDNFEDIYWNGTFSCKQINLSGEIAGLELTLYTNSPYPYLAIQPISYSLQPNNSFSLNDTSDKVGAIYPKLTIVCNGGNGSENSKIKLSNNMDNKFLFLSNLSKGEVITIDGDNKLIFSSINRDNLSNSFNYYYPRIFNKIENGNDIRENIFSLSSDSIPCDITFEYSPIIKVGL